MTESCRLVTTEQLKEYKLLEKKLDIALRALKIERNELVLKLNMLDATLKEIEGVKE